MAAYIPAIKTSELPDGSMKKVEIGGKTVLVAHTGGKYYAMENRCAHAGGDLSAGKLEGNIVTCPRHGSQWDLTDGHNVRWMRSPDTAAKVPKIGVYPVKIEGDSLMVEI